MALPHYLWSRTAASNATADPTVNWAEGMPPSAVNDSARAMMASAAGFRDDISGAIVTGGTSTAYTVTSYQVFDTLAHLSGQLIAFTPHATNGATVTLNVDGLGAKPLRTSPGVDLLAGTLVLGSPYVALYNASDSAFYLCNFYVNPYNVPLGGMMDYIGTTAPNSAFVLPIGQAISTTTYATLYALVGTTYNTGGETAGTFRVPDLTGRVTAMKEASATRLTSTHFGGNSTVLGAVGGSESTTLTAAQIPSLTSTGSNSISVVSVAGNVVTGTVLGNAATAASATRFLSNDGGSGPLTSTGTNSISVTTSGTSGTAHRTVPPLIIVNKILRVL